MSFHIKFLSSQVISMVGTWIQQVVIMALAFKYYPDPTWFTLFVVAGQAPVIGLLVFFGKIGDRLGRGFVWRWSQYLGLAVASLGAILSTMDAINIQWLFVMNILLGINTAIDISNRQGFVYDNYEKAHKAVSLDISALNIARIIGPLVGGYFLMHQEYTLGFIINGLTYVIVLFLLSSYCKKSNRVIPSSTTVGNQRNTTLQWKHYVVALGIWSTAVVPITALYPVLNKMMAGDDFSLAVLYIVSGVGSLLINSTWSSMSNMRHRYSGLYFATCTNLVFLILLFHSIQIENKYVGWLAFFVHGIANSLVASTLQTLTHMEIQHEYRAWSTAFSHRSYLICGSLAALLSSMLIATVGWTGLYIQYILSLLGFLFFIGYIRMHIHQQYMAKWQEPPDD